jgi:hypothetical protein
MRLPNSHGEISDGGLHTWLGLPIHSNGAAGSRFGMLAMSLAVRITVGWPRNKVAVGV